MSDGMRRELVYLSSHATNRYFIPNWGNFNDENMNEIEIKPEGIGSGENIVFVANQFWNASGSSDDKFNYLIVGTQSGDNYKLYFYNINGGAPDGKPLMTKEGKGKVKCIRFLNTKYSGGGMASTLDYNANY